jgi:hypothetical protein
MARLKKHGFKNETEASATNKLKRGTFPATWFAIRFDQGHALLAATLAPQQAADSAGKA